MAETTRTAEPTVGVQARVSQTEPPTEADVRLDYWMRAISEALALIEEGRARGEITPSLAEDVAFALSDYALGQRLWAVLGAPTVGAAEAG